nr:uncharacterized protein LOC124809584 [Hydra vulgaris]
MSGSESDQSSQFSMMEELVTDLASWEPFTVALYCGNTKPTDVNAFLKDFVEEIKDLQETGIIFNNVCYEIKISALVCDTTARAFIKRIKGHSAYHGCDKCVQHGFYAGRTTFTETAAALGTDSSFIEMKDQKHHYGKSPLVAILSLGLILKVPADYMHLVCLGVIKKMVFMWLKGPLATRLGPRVVKDLSEKLVDMRPFIPSEFARNHCFIKNKAAINCEIPSEKWSKHSCRILGTKDSYAKARSELGKAEITSDLQSDVDVSRLRTKRIQKYLKDDNDNSDEYSDKDSQQINKQPLCQVSKKREGSAEGSNRRSKTKSHKPAPKAPPFPVSCPCSLTPSSPVISERAIPESISQPFTRAIERGSELSTSHVASQQSVTPATTSSWQSATSTSAACYRISTHAASELHTISRHNLEDISFVSAGAFIEGELEQVKANLVPNIPTSLSISATSLNATELSTAASHTSAQTSNSVLNKIFTLLVELKSEVANLQKQTTYNTTMLQTLSQGGIQDDGNIFETLDLPVCDRKQLQHLEDIITKDNLLFNKLVHGVASKGGQDLKEAVGRMVSSLMENDVVKQMNWSGLGENLKKPFRDLKWRQVLENNSEPRSIALVNGCEIDSGMARSLITGDEGVKEQGQDTGNGGALGAGL